MSTALQDPQVRAYLDELRRLTAGSPDGPLIVDGVERHVEDALAGAPADPTRVRAVLSELGDPATIAAEASPAAAPAPAPFLERRSGAVLTVLVLTFGGVVVPVLGWVVGLVLLWSSRVWTFRQKAVGTLAPFAGAVLLDLVGLLVTETTGSTLAFQHLGLLVGLVAGALGAAVLLLAQASTRG